jgi:hypothetical protein
MWFYMKYIVKTYTFCTSLIYWTLQDKQSQKYNTGSQQDEQHGPQQKPEVNPYAD